MSEAAKSESFEKAISKPRSNKTLGSNLKVINSKL
jgi:hypothetical protein